MTPSEITLIQEFTELYPDKKLYGVPNKIFMDYHRRFPYGHCCHFFFGKATAEKGKDYISIIPLLEKAQEETIPENYGMNNKEFIFADDLE